jgi:hypothetical protein
VFRESVGLALSSDILQIAIDPDFYWKPKARRCRVSGLYFPT